MRLFTRGFHSATRSGQIWMGLALVVALMVATWGFAPSAHAGADGLITGTVFQDLNGDGMRGPGEPALPHRAVYLQRVDVEVAGAAVLSVTSNAEGVFVFEHLPAGTYRVDAEGGAQAVVVVGSVQAPLSVDLAVSHPFRLFLPITVR